MNKLQKHIKGLNLENIIWFVYIFLVSLNIISNKYEYDHVVTGNTEYRNIFRSINLFVVIVGIWIYTYFLIQNLNQTHDNKNPKKVHLNNVSVIASLVFFIGGILNIYLALNGFDEDIDL